MKNIPFFDTSEVTSFYRTFINVYLVKELPEFDTSKATNFGNMLFGTRVQVIPAFNMENGTSFTGTFTSTFITWSDVTGVTETHSYLNCNLLSEALDNIYTNLAYVTGKTITVTGNPGVTGDDPSIATNKGWTVTG